MRQRALATGRWPSMKGDTNLLQPADGQRRTAGSGSITSNVVSTAQFSLANVTEVGVGAATAASGGLEPSAASALHFRMPRLQQAR